MDTAGARNKTSLVLLYGSAANILGRGAAIPEYGRDCFVLAAVTVE